MNIAYVLIVVSTVSFGTNVSQQEYTSKSTCEAAAVAVGAAAASKGHSKPATVCIPK